LIASVKVAEPRKPIKKKDIIKALVVRTSHPIRRKDGGVVRFDENAVVVIDEKGEPKSTRVFGPIPREIKEKGYTSVFSMAEEIV